jgi:hypothetical protein
MHPRQGRKVFLKRNTDFRRRRESTLESRPQDHRDPHLGSRLLRVVEAHVALAAHAHASHAAGAHASHASHAAGAHAAHAAGAHAAHAVLAAGPELGRVDADEVRLGLIGAHVDADEALAGCPLLAAHSDLTGIPGGVGLQVRVGARGVVVEQRRGPRAGRAAH